MNFLIVSLLLAATAHAQSYTAGDVSTDSAVYETYKDEAGSMMNYAHYIDDCMELVGAHYQYGPDNIPPQYLEYLDECEELLQYFYGDDEEGCDDEEEFSMYNYYHYVDDCVELFKAYYHFGEEVPEEHTQYLDECQDLLNYFFAQEEGKDVKVSNYVHYVDECVGLFEAATGNYSQYLTEEDLEWLDECGILLDYFYGYDVEDVKVSDYFHYIDDCRALMAAAQTGEADEEDLQYLDECEGLLDYYYWYKGDIKVSDYFHYVEDCFALFDAVETMGIDMVPEEDLQWLGECEMLLDYFYNYKYEEEEIDFANYEHYVDDCFELFDAYHTYGPEAIDPEHLQYLDECEMLLSYFYPNPPKMSNYFHYVDDCRGLFRKLEVEGPASISREEEGYLQECEGLMAYYYQYTGNGTDVSILPYYYNTSGPAY